MTTYKTPQQLSAELMAISNEIEASICKIVEMLTDQVIRATSQTIFSQRDERWAGQLLGAGPQTLGQAGCLVSCAASVLSDAGYTTNPAQLNTWLKAHDGFVMGNLFVWSSVAKVGVVKHTQLLHCPGPNDTPITLIQKTLLGGGFAIAQVDFKTGGEIDQHWVRILSIDDHDAMIMDPWQLPEEENPRWLCPRYGTTPATAIWKVGLYERVKA